jgi:hypothetical protein
MQKTVLSRSLFVQSCLEGNFLLFCWIQCMHGSDDEIKTSKLCDKEVWGMYKKLKIKRPQVCRSRKILCFPLVLV